jgi:hypothetical protein
MSSAGLENHSENDITDNIVLSLQKDTERRLSLVHNFAPRILHKGIENFSGCEGSQTYRYFVERIFEYKSFFFVNRKMRIA